MSGFSGWPENLQAASPKNIDDPGGERCFRTNDGEMNAFFLSKVGQRYRVGDIDIPDFGFTRRAGVAGRDKNPLNVPGFAKSRKSSCLGGEIINV